MLSRHFTYCKHEDLGYYGLRPNWMSNADPFDGLGCAHDMLEHFPTQTTALEGEFEALGAMMHLRLENGWHLKYKRGPRELEKQLGALLSSCLVDMVSENLEAPSVIRTRPLSDADSESALQAALDLAMAESLREMDDVGEASAQRLKSPAVRAAMESWVRRGYRRAARRYARHDICDISDRLFAHVSTELDQLIRGGLRDGDQVAVSLDLCAFKVHLRVNGLRVSESRRQ